MPAGAMRDRRSKRVTPSPFFSDDTYPDERLRGFSNGVAIRSDSVTFILENGPEEIAGFYPGDTLRLPDGQQAMIEEIYRSEVTVSASGLAVNQYTDGYPYRSTVVPDTTGKTAMPVQAIEHLSRIPQSAGISAHSGDIVYLDGQDSCRVRTVSDGDIYCRPEGSGTRSAPIVRQGDVWSMYSGLLEDTYGIFNPSGTDYVIHALGREGRADYVRKFTETKPRFVLTIRPDYMPHERWLEINYWPIYEELLRNYRIADFTGYSIIWERLGKPNDLDDTPWQQVAHDPDDANIILPKSERDEFVVVELTYSIDNPFASIPLVGNSPRYMVLPIDTETPLPVSLPPYQRTWTFDIAVRK